MPHFFIHSEDFKDGFVTISDKETYNHIAKSLRAKTGEDILLIDENQIQYEGKIKQINSKSIEIEVIKHYKSARSLGFELYLAQSPLRSDSQNLIMEKATELGVEGVYPIFTDNCALKKSVIEQKIEKWQKIMFEASKQCERAKIPTCFELSDIKTLINDSLPLTHFSDTCPSCRKISLSRKERGGVAEKFDRILAFTERSAQFNLKDYLSEKPIQKNEKILVIIGPEGGFSPREFEFFAENKITTLTLGDLILKADTAVIVALGNIVL